MKILYWVLALGCASAYCVETKAEIVEAPHAYLFHGWTVDGTSTNHSYGTAFPISKHELLTCEHVLNKENFAIQIDGKDCICKCVRCDEELDVALLHCDLDLSGFDLAIDDAAECQVFGAPLGTPVRNFDAVADPETKLANRIEHCYAADGIASGCSGGPCVHNGKVIGMFRGIVPGTNRFGMIPTRRINAFLNETDDRK